MRCLICKRRPRPGAQPLSIKPRAAASGAENQPLCEAFVSVPPAECAHPDLSPEKEKNRKSCILSFHVPATKDSTGPGGVPRPKSPVPLAYSPAGAWRQETRGPQGCVLGPFSSSADRGGPVGCSFLDVLKVPVTLVQVHRGAKSS